MALINRLQSITLILIRYFINRARKYTHTRMHTNQVRLMKIISSLNVLTRCKQKCKKRP